MLNFIAIQVVPCRAQAMAALEPLPPGPMLKLCAIKVSPRAIGRGMRETRSAFQLAMQTTSVHRLFNAMFSRFVARVGLAWGARRRRFVVPDWYLSGGRLTARFTHRWVPRVCHRLRTLGTSAATCACAQGRVLRDPNRKRWPRLRSAVRGDEFSAALSFRMRGSAPEHGTLPH